MGRHKTIQAECEVDMRDFEVDDLTDELQERLKTIKKTDKDKAHIIMFCQDVITEHRADPDNLLDQQKNELFEEARDRFTIAELTERLKP